MFEQRASFVNHAHDYDNASEVFNRAHGGTRSWIRHVGAAASESLWSRIHKYYRVVPRSIAHYLIAPYRGIALLPYGMVLCSATSFRASLRRVVPFPHCIGPPLVAPCNTARSSVARRTVFCRAAQILPYPTVPQRTLMCRAMSHLAPTHYVHIKAHIYSRPQAREHSW